VDEVCRKPSSVIYPKRLLKVVVFADRSTPMTRLRAVSALASVTILSLALPTLTFADSQIRMVRLSQVDGTVQIDRNSGNGFEKAIPNMPITQGVRLQTGSNGRAEVEMEDGTTIRLAPDTAMSFPELVLRDSGVRASTAQLTLGTAYFNVLHKKKEEVRVTFAHQSIDVDHQVRFRVSVDLATAKVSVFKGELKIPNPVETATLKKEQTATFDLVDEKQVATAKGIDTLPTDNWDAERSEFQRQYTGSVYGSTPYGAAPDLAYYGQYSYVPGTGYLWQPFGITSGWNPYMNGAWAWYSGVGYSYVSMDPWGWIPYHYGAWTYVNGYGWGWTPSGTRTWQPVPRIVRPPTGFQAPAAPVVTRTSVGTSVARPTMVVGQTRTPVGRPVTSFNGAINGTMTAPGGGRTATMGSGATSRSATSMGSAGAYHPPSSASAGAASHNGGGFSGGGGGAARGGASTGGRTGNPR
jgi:hypothetical protein